MIEMIKTSVVVFMRVRKYLFDEEGKGEFEKTDDGDKVK